MYKDQYQALALKTAALKEADLIGYITVIYTGIDELIRLQWKREERERERETLEKRGETFL